MVLHPPTLTRRGLLLGAAAGCLPLPSLATAIYTPHELRQAYRREVRRRLDVRREEGRLHGGVSELQLFSTNQELVAPQYSWWSTATRTCRFLDEYGVLDAGSGRPQRHGLPYRGRHLLMVDSERDERPGWSPPPVA